MSLPENTLSTIALPAPYVGARAIPSTSQTEDHENGGIAIQDASKGINFQSWRGFVENDMIYLEAPTVPKVLVYVGTNITELSISFDRNMNYCLAFVEDGLPKLRWYNTTVTGMVTTELDPNIKNPRVCHDDKRDSQTENSDIILAYLRDGRLYVRYQRDRYTVEYDPTIDLPVEERTAFRSKVAEALGLIKIGMNSGYRVQFMFRAPKRASRPGTEEPTVNYTLSLNHFNTATGNTSTDVYTTPWSLEKGAKILPTGGRFGGCVEVGGMFGSYVRSPTGVPLNIGLEDRQYEFYVKCVTYPDSPKAFFTLYTGIKGWSSVRLESSPSGIIARFIDEDQINWKNSKTIKSGAGSLDVWTHIAVTITGGNSRTVKIYIGGILSHTEEGWIMPAGESGTIHLGYQAGISNAVYQFDEFKTNSKITYATNFTPPALPFTA